MYSPFAYDNLPSNEQFFGRNKDLEKLSQVVSYSNNLLIFSKRRMGKTSLIKHFIEQNKKEYCCIYVDIFDITTKEDLAKALLRSLSNAENFDIKTSIKKFTSLFKRVRVEPTIDPNTLEYSIKPIVATLTFQEMMEDFFASVKEIAKTKKVIITIDEFQQIATIKEIPLDAYLRKEIQTRSNTSYIFAGSKRHLLTSLFEYKAPLYEMASHYELLPLSQTEIYNYARLHLPITKDLIGTIFQKADGETKLIIHILHLLFIGRANPIEHSLINEATKEIVQSKDSSYRLLLDTLSNNQKTALKIVGKYKKGFFIEEILKEYNIKKQTLQSSIEALFKKELIDKDGSSYFIPDRTLELWVETIAN